ncbi:FkbM family methyltransferase [Dongia mobilis]|uniref:FkbM family methyltransferase n=1 Tax=Dongia mobilis TaxID=578943 RepID=A0A4R6WQK0_9PROT|nr:FkbM family methyltransferase [Dongia mobilis]TDQ83825.1 FkbM family methyltransferase [Dongia mobilis]
MTQPRILTERLAANPLHCIDVGARGGMQDHWRPYAGLMQIDLFEPDEAACALQARQAPANESWFPVALGGTTGTGRLHVLQKPSGSSLYPPNPDLMFRFGPTSYGTLAKVIEVPLLTLSDFIDRHQRPLPNLVKLDVQGAELDIFKGTRDEHLAEVLAIQTEVEFAELYRGQPLFTDLDAHLQARGFVLFDILPVRSYRFVGNRSHAYLRRHLNILKNRRDISCRLIAGDALYLRDPEAVLAGGDVTAALKLFVILLLYRFLDEALWLAEAGRDQGRWSAAEADALIALVKAAAPRPGLLQRADWLGKLARKLSRVTGIGHGRKADYWLDRSWDF